MTGLAQVHFSFLGDDGHAGDEVERGLGLGHQEVDLADEDGPVQEVGDAGADLIAEGPQDTGDLPFFGEMQLADFVLDGYDLGGLDEGRLAGRGLVVNEAGNLPLAAGRDGDQVFAVADGNARVGFREALGLRLPEDGGGPLGDGSFLLLEGFAEGGELG